MKLTAAEPGPPPLERFAPLLCADRRRVPGDAVAPAADHFAQRRLRAERRHEAARDAIPRFGDPAPHIRREDPPRTLVVQIAAYERRQGGACLWRRREEVLHVEMPFFMNRARPMSETVGLARAARSLRVQATRRTRS